MNEQQAFIAMLVRAGIGHGLRHDYNPEGTAVLVEHEQDDPMDSEWWFDADGRLKTTHVYKTDVG